MGQLRQNLLTVHQQRFVQMRVTIKTHSGAAFVTFSPAASQPRLLYCLSDCRLTLCSAVALWTLNIQLFAQGYMHPQLFNHCIFIFFLLL